MAKIITLTGASCSGKSTLQQKLIDILQFKRLRSTTTRKMRKGDQEGGDYYFVSKEEFENKIKNSELIQYVEFSGNYYGVTKKEVDNNVTDDNPVVIVVEPTGIDQYKEFAEKNNYDFTSIFIDISLDSAIKRMTSRDNGSDSLNSRIENLENKEMKWRDLDYDLFIDCFDSKTELMVLDLITKEIKEQKFFSTPQ